MPVAAGVAPGALVVCSLVVVGVVACLVFLLPAFAFAFPLAGLGVFWIGLGVTFLGVLAGFLFFPFGVFPFEVAVVSGFNLLFL